MIQNSGEGARRSVPGGASTGVGWLNTLEQNQVQGKMDFSLMPDLFLQYQGSTKQIIVPKLEDDGLFLCGD